MVNTVIFLKVFDFLMKCHRKWHGVDMQEKQTNGKEETGLFKF